MSLLLVQYPQHRLPPSALGNITGGDTPGDAYQDSFTFDVVDEGLSVLFKIANSGNAAAPSMFIRQVFLMIMAICLIPWLTLITLVR